MLYAQDEDGVMWSLDCSGVWFLTPAEDMATARDFLGLDDDEPPERDNS